MKLKKIGYVPVCVGGERAKIGHLGAWVGWFKATRPEMLADVNGFYGRGAGLDFRIVPVYVKAGDLKR